MKNTLRDKIAKASQAMAVGKTSPMSESGQAPQGQVQQPIGIMRIPKILETLNRTDPIARLTKFAKVDFPSYDGIDNLRGWLYKCNRFFKGEMQDPIISWKNLSQMGSVNEYQKDFERIRVRVKCNEKQVVSMFVGGLKEKLQYSVTCYNPKSIVEAFALAKHQELFVNSIIEKLEPFERVLWDFKRRALHFKYNDEFIKLLAVLEHMFEKFEEGKLSVTSPKKGQYAEAVFSLEQALFQDKLVGVGAWIDKQVPKELVRQNADSTYFGSSLDNEYQCFPVMNLDKWLLVGVYGHQIQAIVIKLFNIYRSWRARILRGGQMIQSIL
ncbi:hypothetical protein SLEP1_g27127 [Rubroshorea leprosula]|uniref:Retrotransposon gag domain-containing protein n=1 Tax=Rubroshorea leprosula TaxID=152421 RepID=A0AAV5JP89_9ROSI|nr:hypothetical protein SLEP1_g27127 [Rubroshorea leprosula]